MNPLARLARLLAPAPAPARRPARTRLGLSRLEGRELMSATGIDSPALAGGWQSAVGDFNRDGWPDLVTTSGDGPVALMLGKKGTGSFAAPVDLRAKVGSLGPNPEGLAVADFNGDNRLDVAVASYGWDFGANAGRVTVLYGDGGGGFRVGQRLTLRERDIGAGGAAPGATYLAAVDMDGDGRTDLAVSEYNASKVLVYRNQGGGWLSLHDWNYSAGGVSNPNQVVAGDFTGDGRPDLAVANTGNNSVTILAGLGGGLVTAAKNIPLFGPNRVVGLAAGDLTRDGRLDLVASGYRPEGSAAPNLVHVLDNQGGLSFGARSMYLYNKYDSGTNVAIGDFDADGYTDFAVSSPYDFAKADGGWNQLRSTVTVFRNGSASNLSSAPSFAAYQVTVAPGPVGLVAADLNGDGNLDLLTTSLNGNVSFIGNRTWRPF